MKSARILFSLSKNLDEILLHLNIILLVLNTNVVNISNNSFVLNAVEWLCYILNEQKVPRVDSVSVKSNS